MSGSSAPTVSPCGLRTGVFTKPVGPVGQHGDGRARGPGGGQQIFVNDGFVDVRTPHFNWNGPPPTVELPYLPLWPGLILNTLFYAAIWWGLLALPRLIRRVVRTRRGLCPRCAYDMRGLTNTPCPECGHACRPCGAR